MRKCRLTFEKLGTARYISHLDLMRVFRRMFNRADVAVKHSEGYNPHPILSVVLPLPLGHESVCEALDVTFEEGVGSLLRLPELLNPALPHGIRITAAAVPMMGAGDVALVRSELTALIGAWRDISEEITVEKTTKNGNVRKIVIEPASLERVSSTLLIATLPPDVNAALAANALGAEFCSVRRTAIYNASGTLFR